MRVSIVIPARNEAGSLATLLPKIHQTGKADEIIVVSDGSTDETEEVCIENDVKIINHPYRMGNGAAVKTGARVATGDVIVFMDGDGQHNPDDISRLIIKINAGYDMVIGARQKGSQASIGRSIANDFYNTLSSYMTNQKIEDLTSGFRAVRTKKFREFLYLLPNGFSYPTTITMAFFRAGYAVAYEPIIAEKRVGKSHIKPIKDGIRFLLIIMKIGTMYSPLKLFTPIAFLHALAGIAYYGYTFSVHGRLSIMTVFMLTAAVTIFLIGLVSEQITQLMYRNSYESVMRKK